jgi:hypothetical protein
MKKHPIIGILCTLTLVSSVLLAQEATSPTITLNVPVQLSNLHPDVQQVYIVGTLYERNLQGALGSATQVLHPPSDGNINQTVTLVISADPGKDLAAAKFYGAAMSFHVGSNTSAIPSQSADTPVGYKAKDGTPFTQNVTGPINW